MIVVVMGVTGAGKTTVGGLLAKRLGWEFADADDFHSASNKEKMKRGTPLTDADRAPWLAALHQQIARWIVADVDQQVGRCDTRRERVGRMLAFPFGAAIDMRRGSQIGRANGDNRIGDACPKYDNQTERKKK